MRKKRNGFTLIELLVVATIIVVLSAIGLVSFTNAGKSARNSKRKSDLETVRQALVLYKSDTGGYPIALSEVETKTADNSRSNLLGTITQLFTVPVAYAAASPGGTNLKYNTMIGVLTPDYISEPTPVDPKSGLPSCGTTGTVVCDYLYTGTATAFTLEAPLEGDVNYVLTNP